MNGLDYRFFVDKYERKFNTAQHIAVLISFFFWVCIPAALILAGYYLYFNVPEEYYPEGEGCVHIVLLVIFFLFPLYLILKYPLNLYYKNRIIKGILKEEFCDAYVRYAPDQTICEQQLKDTGILGVEYTDFKGEDLFYGERSGCEYGFSEFSLKKRVKAGRHSYHINMLSGLVFCTKLQMPANVDWENVHLMITPRDILFNSSIPDMYQIDRLEDMDEGLVPEDIDIYCYGTDDEMALLTPELISLAREAFQNFDFLTGGKAALVIKDNRLTFYAINDEDLFSTSLKQMAIKQHAERDFKCIYAISSILNGLQQYKMIGEPAYKNLRMYRGDAPGAVFLDTQYNSSPFILKFITTIYFIAAPVLMLFAVYSCLYASLPIMLSRLFGILVSAGYVIACFNIQYPSRVKSAAVTGIFVALLAVSGLKLNIESVNLFGHTPLTSGSLTALIEVPELPDSLKDGGRPTVASYMEAKEWKCVVRRKTEECTITIYAIIPDTFRITPCEIDNKLISEYLQKNYFLFDVDENRNLIRNNLISTDFNVFDRKLNDIFGYARVIIRSEKGVVVLDGKMSSLDKFGYVVRREGTAVRESYSNSFRKLYRKSYFDSYNQYKLGKFTFKVYGDKFVVDGNYIKKDMPQYDWLIQVRKFIDNDILKHRAEFAPYKAKLDSLQHQYSDRL